MCVCFLCNGSRQQTPCLFLSLNLISNPGTQSPKCISHVVCVFFSLVPLYPLVTVTSSKPPEKLQIVFPLSFTSQSLWLRLSSLFPTERYPLCVLITSVLCLKFPLASSWIKTVFLLVSCYMRQAQSRFRGFSPSHFLTSTRSTL